MAQREHGPLNIHMLLIPPKLIHIVEAVLYIALQPGASPVNGKLLASMQDIPPRYLESMLQQLVRGDILRSVRGPRGGYLLARERRKITLGDIISVFNDSENQSSEKKTLAERIVRPALTEASAKAYDHLKHITLAELCDSARYAALAKQAQANPYARAEYEI